MSGPSHEEQPGAGGPIPDGAAAAVDAIRRGLPAADEDFDQLFAPAFQRVSRRFWTPVAVATAAARMLVTRRTTRVLDVGAGVGKLCLVGALSTAASFTGVERRGALVDVARGVAERLGLRGATFLHGEIEAIDWGAYDALYLFNPFEENLYQPTEQLDQSVPLSDERFERDIAVVEQALAAARIGTRVVTYHGFGGRIPSGYRLVEEATAGSDRLRLWVRVSRPAVAIGRAGAEPPVL